jgi:hypothetical protein
MDHKQRETKINNFSVFNIGMLSNGMDRSCEATIYPVLDKPHTTGAFQDRRKIEALLRPA